MFVVYETLDEAKQGFVSFLGSRILNVSDFVVNVTPGPRMNAVAANKRPLGTKRLAGSFHHVQ